VPGLGDHEAAPRAHDSRRLAEDDLQVARVVALVRELAGTRGGLDVVESHDATLGLRDRLLRHDHDVAVLEAGRARDQPAEVVALLDLGQALDREDAKLAH
jgi:hypothetical protein